MVMDKLMRKFNTNPPVKKKLARTSIAATNTFGVALKLVIERDQTDIPIIVMDIFDFLTHGRGLDTEGLFRVNGNSRTIDLVRHWVDEAGSDWYVSKLTALASDSYPGLDMHSITGLLKLYLRELPTGLVPTNLTVSFIEALNFHRQDQSARVSSYVHLLTRLPASNYTLLQQLCQFLHHVWLHRSSTKMSSESLGIVFGPNVFRVEDDAGCLPDQSSANEVMRELIEYNDVIFRMAAPTSRSVSRVQSKNVRSSVDQSNWKSCNDSWNSPRRSSVSSTSDSLSTTLGPQCAVGVTGSVVPTTASSQCNYTNDLSIGLAAAIKVCIEEHFFRSSTHSAVIQDDNPKEFHRIQSDSDGRSPEQIDPQTKKQRVPTVLTRRLQQLQTCLHDYEQQYETRFGRKPTLGEKRADPKIRDLIREIYEIRAQIKLLKDSSANLATTSSIDLHGSRDSLTSNTTVQPANSLPTTQTSVQTIWNSLPNCGELGQSDRNNEISTAMHHIRVPTNSKPSRWSSGYGTIGEDHSAAPKDRVHADVQPIEVGSPLKETYSMLMRRLTDKRSAANRPDDLHLMAPKQIEAEKLDLQKALLYFEGLHGRPKTSQERFVMRPLYDRYRIVKRLLSDAHKELDNRQTTTSPIVSDAVKNSESEDHLLSSSDGDQGIREDRCILSKRVRQPSNQCTQTHNFSRLGTNLSHTGNGVQENPLTKHSIFAGAKVCASLSSGDEEIPTIHSPHSKYNPHSEVRLGPRLSCPSASTQHHKFSQKCSQSAAGQCSPNGDHRHWSSSTVSNRYTDAHTSDPESPKPIARNSEGSITKISQKNIRTISSPSERVTQNLTCPTSPNITTWSLEQLNSEVSHLRSAKRGLQKRLKDFEHDFENTTGHKLERADRLCMRAEYNQYKYLKTRLDELEHELNSRLSS